MSWPGEHCAGIPGMCGFQGAELKKTSYLIYFHTLVLTITWSIIVLRDDDRFRKFLVIIIRIVHQ